MLSSLIVLGSWLLASKPVESQNSQFPKPDLVIPATLRDTSVFKYLSSEDLKLERKPFPVGRDWSNLVVPAINPNAIKLKILLAVAERDFSNPNYSNTLEMRDKTRLLEAMGRLKSLFLVVSDGMINLEIIPRFIPEPIYDIQEFKQIIDSEFNKSKFEADDSTERGPFAAVIAISSSHVADQPEIDQDYVVRGFSDIGGSGPDMWFEEALFYVAQSGIRSRLLKHYGAFDAGYSSQESRSLLIDSLATMRGEYQAMFDPNFRNDAELVSKWSQLSLRQPGRPIRTPEMAAIQAPASINVTDGVLTYSELSIMRAGKFALPASSQWKAKKALRFEIRTKNHNHMDVALQFEDGTGQMVSIGDEPGMIPFGKDNEWQTITINFPQQTILGVTIGAQHEFEGKTRLRAELVQCDFRNFELLSDVSTAPQPVNPNLPAFTDEASIKEALTTGNKTRKRTALANIDLIKGLKGLETTLLSATSDLDAGVARDATKAYFELILANQPTPEQLANLGKFLVSPPNEASREVALLYIEKSQAYAKFDMVIGNTVRDSWRVRRAAGIALGALLRANIKEKEVCHQMLLSSTGQEMALIRLTAISQLDPEVSLDSQRIEHLMVNDPCESVRLACLKILATKSNFPKEKMFGCLADDSPTLRERIPAALGNKHPLYREFLQKMVVDQDPYVRLSALRKFALLPGVAGETTPKIREGEIQSLFSDKHPAVQLELLMGATKYFWKIPAEALDRLKLSPIPNIRAWAEGIK